MIARVTSLLTIMFMVLAPQPAHAIWERSESVEWWTNVSDTITSMQVTEAKPIDQLNEYYLSQQVACGRAIPLKGGKIVDITIRQDYWKGKDRSFFDQPLRAGDRVLIFRAHLDAEHEPRVAFWLNLSKPDAVRSLHAAYDNDCKLLTDEKSIINLVKSRITAERPDTARRRGLIVSFSNWKDDVTWDFVRTADPEYKKVLVKLLRESKFPGDRESAIFNLASYPGDDTVKLVRPFLDDPQTSMVYKYGPDGRTIQFYPIRQAAYLALAILGAKVEEPKPYFKDVQTFEFETGFENPIYFPYGDWMRLKLR